MTLWAKALTNGLDNLSSSRGPDMVEGGNQLLQFAL